MATKKKEKKQDNKTKQTKKEVKLDKKIADILEKVEKLSVLELADLVKALEDKFGVSAAPVAAAPAAGNGNGGDNQQEEKSEYDVELKSAGDNKIAVIKALREIRKDLGLVDAKKLVDGAPEIVLEAAPTEEAKQAEEKLKEAGADIELK